MQALFVSWEVSMLGRALLVILLPLYFVRSDGVPRQSDISAVPKLHYFTYLGGDATERGTAVAVEPSGGVYVGGTTWSADFPVAKAFQPACDSSRRCHDAFLSRLDASGRKLLFSTFLDERNVEAVTGIATDKEGNVFISVQYTGVMGGVSLGGVVSSPPDGSPAPGGGFVARFDSSGRQVYRTALRSRGFSAPEGITVDNAGNAYVTGWMPRDASPMGRQASFQGSAVSVKQEFHTFYSVERCGGGFAGAAGQRDAFVVKLDSSGRITKEIALGGAGDDSGYAIAVDGSGNAWVTGSTTSADFPLVNPLRLSGPASAGHRIPGDTDLFIAKVDMANGGVLYSTTFGGSSRDVGYGIALDSSGGVYVAGGTASADFPTLNSAQGSLAGGVDAFVAKLNEDGLRLAFSTYLGAGGLDVAMSIALDGEGAAYLAGTTESPDFPVLNAAGVKDGCKGSVVCSDAFVAQLDANGRIAIVGRFGGEAREQATGIAVDTSGAVYITGTAHSAHLGSQTALNRSLRGVNDAFLARFDGFSLRRPSSSDQRHRPAESSGMF